MRGAYLRIAQRMMRKHPGYAVINILGLTIGMASCILMLLFVRHERAFDDFHRNADRIYRLNKVVTPQEGGSERHAITSGPMGPALAADYAEVEQAVRFMPWFGDVLLARGDTTVKSPSVALADANFFEVFAFELIRGDPATVLDAPMTMVLTESTAHRLFGDDDAVGETVTGLNGRAYEISGIAANPPDQSHMEFDAVISWASTRPGETTLDFGWLEDWLPQALYTYILLAPDAAPEDIDAKFPDFMQRRFQRRADQYHLYLQPIGDIYLGSSNVLFGERVRGGNGAYVQVASVVAVLILLIACVNFVNLVTARSSRRAKEVGVRKVLGADRPQLTRQFLTEAMLTATIATIFAALLVELARPLIEGVSGKDLALSTLGLPMLIGLLVGLPIVVGILSGFYPAAVLSAFRPVRALSGYEGPRANPVLPRALVTAQFAISVVLISGTIVIYNQLSYVQNRDLGFDAAQVVSVTIGSTSISDQFDAFKSEVLRHPQVVSATGSNSIPGLSLMGFTLQPEGKPQTETWNASALRVDDFELLDTFGMEMAEGRYLSADFPSDSTGSVVVNETLAEMLGWSDPVGRALDISGETRGARVVGVLKDYHHTSLRHPIAPMAVYFAPRGQMLSVRVSGDNVQGVIAHLRSTWERFESRHPFEYSFVDEALSAQYAGDRQLMQALLAFAVLAVFVACLGLFGLTTFSAERRMKEIGMRKVLGASVGSILLLLSRDLARSVLLALCIGAPVAYLLVQRWLSDYAYHLPLGPGPFIVTGFVALVVAMLTISYQSARVATRNPVKSLRYE